MKNLVPFACALAGLIAIACIETPAAGPAGQDDKPSVDYVLPWRVVAGSSRVHVTVHGRGLEDCAVVTVQRATTKRDVPAHLVNGTLVFSLPDDLVATPGGVSMRIRGGSEISIEVVKSEGPTQTADPFVSKVSPDKAVVPATGKAHLLLYGENIDPKALVLLRPEGEGSEGLRLEASPVDGKARLEAAIPPEAIRESGAYEIRVVNPTARRSNWVRVEIRVGTGS